MEHREQAKPITIEDVKEVFRTTSDYDLKYILESFSAYASDCNFNSPWNVSRTFWMTALGNAKKFRTLKDLLNE